MPKDWNKQQRNFKIGSLVFLLFIALTFISTPEYKKEDLSYKTITLSADPEFKVHCRKGSCSYWLELSSEDGGYEVNGIDYKYLIHERFKLAVKKGNKVRIGYVGSNVISLSKMGFDFLQFEKAQYHKQQNRLFSRCLFSAGFLLCIFPLFFKETPRLKWDEGVYYKIKLSRVFIIGMILSLIIFTIAIGTNFISGDEFAE